MASATARPVAAWWNDTFFAVGGNATIASSTDLSGDWSVVFSMDGSAFTTMAIGAIPTE
jgi:hypothetical protein